MDEEVKRLMRMHKLELLGLLQEVTEENDRLRANCRQLEEANAKLALSNHELNMECDALHGELTALRQGGGGQEDAGRQPYAPSESAYGLPQPETTEERALPADMHTLPPGNFAEAMVAAEQIAARTQAAADAYLARCQEAAEEADAQAKEILAQARQQAESLLEQARTQKAAMERETREVSGRLRGEMQRLNKFMSAMETAEKAEENP